MKQTKQQLYERIMKKVAPIVKQAINEKFSRVNEHAVRHGRKSLLYRSRLNESKTLTSDEFYDISYDVYNDWIHANDVQITNEVAQELEKQGKISPDMDPDELFDIIFDKVEDKFGELLNQAVGGDWNEVGLQSGLDDYDLERLYVDDMQAKCDCVTDFITDYAENGWNDDDDDDSDDDTDNNDNRLSPEAQKFYDQTDKAYDKWCRIGYGVSEEIAEELEKKGVISPDMDEDDVFDEIYDVAMKKFGELLDKAVGGDWNEVGKQVGLDDYDLEHLYVDSMQAKCDCVGEVARDYVNSDED